jgi:hypothetical protein
MNTFSHTTRVLSTAALLVASLTMAAVETVTAQDLASGGETNTITKVGTTSAQFLKIGIGSRPIALGGAFVAEANDLSALYWNPAGLALMKGASASFSHTQYLADIDYNYAAFGIPLGNMGTIAASLILLDSGDMQVRTIDRPLGTGEFFNTQSYALQLSYARSLTNTFSIGTTLKYISESIWHSRATAMAFDVGILFTTPYDRLRLGANMANFGGKMQMSGRDILFSQDPSPDQSGDVEIVNAEYLLGKYDLPLLFRVGLAWDAVKSDDHNVLVLLDAAHPNDNSEYVNMGAEYRFRELLSLRIGYKSLFEDDGEQGLTFGGGLNIRIDRSLRAGFDYAYADFGRLEQTHWYTFNLLF